MILIIEKKRRWMILAILLSTLVTCRRSPEQLYRAAESRELASGVRYDSLFKGLYFKMKYLTFREHCMAMHLKHEFYEGGLKSGAWLECKIPGEMRFPAAINFNPEFRDDRLTEMKAAIYYEGISFQQNHLSTDSVLKDVLRLMENWYGKGFIRIPAPDPLKPDIYVKVDGNRRISVYPDEEGFMINLWFFDLSAKKKENEGAYQ